jgi:hypothetical protein
MMVSPLRRASVGGIHFGARRGCTAQAFVITVTLRLHPQSARYAHSGPWAWGLHSHIARPAASKAFWAVSNNMQVLPIVRYGHMPATADLSARDITVILPSVSRESSTRDECCVTLQRDLTSSPHRFAFTGISSDRPARVVPPA